MSIVMGSNNQYSFKSNLKGNCSCTNALVLNALVLVEESLDGTNA